MGAVPGTSSQAAPPLGSFTSLGARSWNFFGRYFNHMSGGSTTCPSAEMSPYSRPIASSLPPELRRQPPAPVVRAPSSLTSPSAYFWGPAGRKRPPASIGSPRVPAGPRSRRSPVSARQHEGRGVGPCDPENRAVAPARQGADRPLHDRPAPGPVEGLGPRVLLEHPQVQSAPPTCREEPLGGARHEARRDALALEGVGDVEVVEERAPRRVL